ncbi:phospholipase D-like domain-containing protein [Paraburkholderia xenovorans]
MKQIVMATVAGALITGASMLWADPTHGATNDVQVAFSPDGGAEQLVLQTIRSARQSIRVMAYSFTAPAVVRALLDAKRRGVDVAVTVDYHSNVDEDRSGKAAAAMGALAYAGVPVVVVRAYPLQHSNRKPGGCYMALRGPVPEFASVDGAVARRHPKGRHEHEDVCHAVRGVEVHDFTTVTVLLVKCVDIDAFHIRHGNKT